MAGHQEMSFSYRGEEILFEIPFAAPYQLMNAALAVRALEVSGLPVAPEQAAEGVKKAKWPARMEEISTGVYLDGAHNADGIRAFLDAACRLKELRKPDHVRILFAVSADKDHQRMLREIAERLKPDLGRDEGGVPGGRGRSVQGLSPQPAPPVCPVFLPGEPGCETCREGIAWPAWGTGSFAYRGVTVSCGGSKGTDQQKHKLTGPFRYAANKAEQGTAELINRAFSGAD